MSTLSPKEFRLYVKAMAEEYKETNYIVQEDKDLYDDLKRENQLLKKSVEKLTKENMQLYIKCKHNELDKQKSKESKKEEEKKVKLDSAYFKKKLNL